MRCGSQKSAPVQPGRIAVPRRLLVVGDHDDPAGRIEQRDGAASGVLIVVTVFIMVYKPFL